MNIINEYEVKEQICDIGKRIYQRGMVAANDGNISVRLNDHEFLCTPTGVSKGYMTPDSICKINEKGELLQSTKNYRPSSEMKMHMRVYEKRPDVNAVVHAHPPYATSFAIAGIPLNQPILAEAVVQLGCVPIAPYATPSTREVPDSIEKFLPYFDAVLLQMHGALTYSADLMSAYMRMESLEFYAQLLLQTRLLGGAKELDQASVEKLYEIRRGMNLPGKHPATVCQNKGTMNCHNCGGLSVGTDRMGGINNAESSLAGQGGGCSHGGCSHGGCGGSGNVTSDTIASITQQVLNQMGIKG